MLQPGSQEAVVLAFFQFGVGEAIVSLASCLLPLTLVGMWVWMLLECLTLEPAENNPDRLPWLLTVLIVPAAGAALYYFVRRPARKLKYGK